MPNSQISSLLSNLFKAISSFFAYKHISYKNESLKDIDRRREQIKNQIINELNSSNPDMFVVDRLYKQLAELNERKRNI